MNRRGFLATVTAAVGLPSVVNAKQVGKPLCLPGEWFILEPGWEIHAQCLYSSCDDDAEFTIGISGSKDQDA